MKQLENKIKKFGKPLVLKKDEFLFNADDDANGFFHLLSGEVRPPLTELSAHLEAPLKKAMQVSGVMEERS